MGRGSPTQALGVGWGFEQGSLESECWVPGVSPWLGKLWPRGPLRISGDGSIMFLKCRAGPRSFSWARKKSACEYVKML